MTEKKVEFILTGNASGMLAATRQVSTAVRTMASDAQNSISKINTVFSTVKTGWLALGSAFMGGTLKLAVDDTIALTKEANALARAFGVSIAQASVLNVGLGDINLTSDRVVSANTRLTRTLLEDEAAFTRLGVATRNHQGQLRSSLDIMLDVNTMLLQFKSGVDRNIEGQKIYGKSWESVQDILKITHDVMAKSEKKAQELGLLIGQDSVKAMARYRSAMGDASDVMAGLKKTISDAVLPAMTMLAQEFAAGGPQAIAILRQSMAGLLVGFYGLKNSIEQVWLTVKAALEQMTVAMKTFAEVANRSLQLDFAGAKQAWLRGTEQLSDIGRSWAADMIASNEKNGAAMRQAWQRGFDGNGKSRGISNGVTPDINLSAADGTIEHSGFRTSVGRSAIKNTSSQQGSRLAQWQNELDQQKLALEQKNQLNRTHYEYSLATEAQFWKSRIAVTTAGSAERYAVESRYLNAQKQMGRDAFAAQMATYKNHIADLDHNYQESIKIAEAILTNTRKKYGEEAKQTIQAYRELLQLQKSYREQQRQLQDQQIDDTRNAHVERLTLEQEQAQLIYQLGAISRATLLRQEHTFQHQLFQIDQEATRRKQAQVDPNKDPVRMDQLNKQLLERERAYLLVRQQLQHSLQLELAQPTQTILGTVEQQITRFLDNTLTNTMSWRDQLGAVFDQIGMTFVHEMVTKPLAAWIMRETGMTAATASGVLARSSAEVTGAATSTALRGTTAVTNITTTAYEAAANVYNAIAAIPYVGPFLAPAMAIGAVGTVLAFAGNIASASKGYDIPPGVNPLVQAHAKEMVLPARYATGLRRLIENEMGFAYKKIGATGAAIDSVSDSVAEKSREQRNQIIHYHDHSKTLDPQLIRRNVRVIAEALKDYDRKS